MVLPVTCPECGKQFRIDLIKAQREIDAPRKELSDLRAKLAASRVMRDQDPFSSLFGKF